ncbi:T6SS phospholipase effector Tle1-like catalytic domain-containing protein, partial [Xanthomonas albilineans]
MGNEHTDAKTWPDDVETYPATAQDLATYAHSRHALAQFQAPLLVSQQSPHTRLFVACFDGTGNDKHKDPQHITNIGILSDQLDLAYSRGINNIRGHYVPGVGTQDDALPRIADGALGYSYGPRMEEMYLKFIRQVHDWRKKDPQAEISILSTGFSRGAVTAAMFTRMVHERGIQDPIGMKIDQGPHGEILKLTPTHPPLVPPGRTAQVVGLLDPVATGEMNFHDVRLPPSVVSGLQLSARDERRDLFPAKDILHPGHSHDGRFLNLVHPGAHSDIGGSYRLDGLSVRNGNLLIDYVNSLSDKPFLQPRAVSSAPEMNVIHRSEQHGSYYTTTMATTLGHRVHVHDLAGPAMTLAPFDAQSLDAELRAHFPLRPVAVSTEHTDPALPAFFRERPHASAAPPLPAYLQQGATPHAVGAPSTHTASTNADTSSSSSSADASTPSQAMDKHSRMQDDLVAQQHQQRIQQAQPLAQSFTQTHAPPSHDSA